MKPILAAMAAACVLAGQPAAADPEGESRAAALELIQKLGAALKQEIAAGGPDRAVAACRDLAPALAGELSRKTGGRVARVSLKTRNSLLGQPDAWEQKVLMDFDRRSAAGEKPESLEYAEIVEEPQGRYLRYMKALPVQPLCLSCHGGVDALSEPVKASLAAHYPLDRATGYSVGQVRGAVTVKQPLHAQP